MTSLPYSEPRKSNRCPVVWLHASDQPNFSSLEYLSHRLMQSGIETQTVITTPRPDNHRQMVDEEFADIKIIETPAETHSAIQSFLNQYKPEFLIWSGGEFKASLLKAAAARGITMLLVNSRAADFPSQRLRFLPDANRRALKGFKQYYAVDASAAHQLSRMGVTPARIKIKGALQQATPIPFLTKELDPDFTDACMGRMVWLAACVTKAEAETVLEAHRLVMRQSHRSLLILVPSSKENEPKIVRMAQKLGLIHTAQSAGDMPNANTQAFICASPEDLYSWYALAPAAFLGQSLSPGKGSLDPYPPAAFGCALLYGPGVSSFMDRYSRLAEQGAARIVKDADSLGTAIVQITNPEQSATMAYAAWNIISEGAELTDVLVDQIVEHFDRSGL